MGHPHRSCSVAPATTARLSSSCTWLGLGVGVGEVVRWVGVGVEVRVRVRWAVVLVAPRLLLPRVRLSTHRLGLLPLLLLLLRCCAAHVLPAVGGGRALLPPGEG